MRGQVALLLEPLAAHLADVRSFPRMDLAVSDQQAWKGERLATHVTLVAWGHLARGGALGLARGGFMDFAGGVLGRAARGVMDHSVSNNLYK